jgi:hypothetical protein
MVVVGNQPRENSQDGELGIDDQQLGRQAVNGEQPEGAEEEEEPQGNFDKENPVEDGVQNDQQEEEEPVAQESSGVAGMGPRRRILAESQCTEIYRTCTSVPGNHGFSVRPTRSGSVVTESGHGYEPKYVFGYQVMYRIRLMTAKSSVC